MRPSNCNPPLWVRPSNNNNRVDNPGCSDLILLDSPYPVCGFRRSSHKRHSMPSEDLQFIWTECFAIEAILICGDPYHGIYLREHRKDEPCQPLLVPDFI